MKKSYRGAFKASLKTMEVDEILKEALEERSEKWLREVLT